MLAQAPPTSAYVHTPFCLSKCHYCDFNSAPGFEWLFGRYARALVTEIETTRERAREPQPLRTAYFGGGTPTLLEGDDLARPLEALRNCFGLAPDAEITTEANPGAIDRQKLDFLRSAGFNRLSLGVQSLDDSFLALLGRPHASRHALDALAAARSAGFDNISIDLMFALPGQSLDHWRRTLDSALDARPQHVSLYELSVEAGTVFAQCCARGELDLPAEETQLRMYETAIDVLTAADYEHYEVSNFALPGRRSRHNVVYWRNQPCYGFGAGASSFVDGARVRRVGDPLEYVELVERTGEAGELTEALTGKSAWGETIALGLRMREGVSMQDLSQRFGVDVLAEFRSEIESMRRRGLLQIDGDRLYATHEGLLLLDTVSAEFVQTQEPGPE